MNLFTVAPNLSAGRGPCAAAGQGTAHASALGAGRSARVFAAGDRCGLAARGAGPALGWPGAHTAAHRRTRAGVARILVGTASCRCGMHGGPELWIRGCRPAASHTADETVCRKILTVPSCGRGRNPMRRCERSPPARSPPALEGTFRQREKCCVPSRPWPLPRASRARRRSCKLASSGSRCHLRASCCWRSWKRRHARASGTSPGHTSQFRKRRWHCCPLMSLTRSGTRPRTESRRGRIGWQPTCQRVSSATSDEGPPKKRWMRSPAWPRRAR
eukprot:scaffold329953_cov53-Tisochrysis_lutea.AAC.3